MPKFETQTRHKLCKMHDNSQLHTHDAPTVLLHCAITSTETRTLTVLYWYSDRAGDNQSLVCRNCHRIHYVNEHSLSIKALSRRFYSQSSKGKLWTRALRKLCRLLSLQVYGTELEKVEVFNGFQDFVETFYIHRGKVKSKAEEEETIVGEFKVKVELNESWGAEGFT